MQNNQIKCRNRVAAHGEVFTSSREVNAMIDLVNNEVDRVESRILEPACGTGNFLTEILRRKLTLIFNKYQNSRVECETNSLIAVGSLYGIDLLEDNLKECKENLLNTFSDYYFQQWSCNDAIKFKTVIEYILEKNIICGDALTMTDASGKSIIFSEWSLAIGGLIKRRDYSFSELLDSSNKKMFGSQRQSTLLDAGWAGVERRVKFIPLPIKEYPLIHYMELVLND